MRSKLTKFNYIFENSVFLSLIKKEIFFKSEKKSSDKRQDKFKTYNQRQEYYSRFLAN